MGGRYVIAKYMRLSKEDGDSQESNSIANQRSLIDNSIKKIFDTSVIDIKEFCDDGYSGITMNRPGIKKLIALTESNDINCIVVKDFSRFSRDYIDIGVYIEKIFPQRQIRFISVNDNYDSIKYIGTTAGIDIAVNNIMYSMYSADLSQKIKSSRKVLCRQGKNIAPYAFYGYVKYGENNHDIDVDNYAARIVKRIFDMRSSGIGQTEIARVLNREGVPTPAMYKKILFPSCGTWDRFLEYGKWTPKMVKGIIGDERYTGKYLGDKNEVVSVGSKKRRRLLNEERTEIANNHPAIVSSEQYIAVQTPTRYIETRQNSYAGVLRGMVRCGGCGHVMTLYGRSADNIKYYCRYKSYTDENGCCKINVPDSDLVCVLSEIMSKILTIFYGNKISQILNVRAGELIKISENLESSISENKKEEIHNYIKAAKGDFNKDELSENLKVIRESRGDLKKRLDMIRASADELKGETPEKIIMRCIKRVKSDSEIMRELIKCVYVYNDKRIKIVWDFCSHI